jgi:hypothetical protein
MLFVVSRPKRRVALVIVVVSGAIAACLGIDPHLSSTAQEAVVINPGSADFGMITVGTTSIPIDIVISPAGTTDQSDMVTGISDSCGLASPFKVMGPLPAPVSRVCMGSGTATSFAEGTGTVCSTTVATYMATFTPAAPGTQSCTINFTGTFGAIPVQLQGTGVAPSTPQIDVSPRVMNFGGIRINTTSPPSTLTIKNTGSQTLTINSITHGDSTFTVGGNVGMHTLAPGGTELHAVTCRPTAVQTYSDSILITSTATNDPSVTVVLSCDGTDSAITMTGNPPDLQTRVAAPIDQIITLDNAGGAQSMVTAIDLVPLAGVGLTKVSQPPLPATLNPGAQVDVQVHYDAAVQRDFGELGRLRVTADGKQSEFVINGGADLTALGLNPDSVDFGAICAGQMAAMPVSVFASAQGDVRITSLTPPGNPFMFTAGAALPATAMGNHGNDVLFTARVAPAIAGPLDDKAVLITDMPGAAMREITLHAEALAPGVGATPRMLDFGTIPANAVAPAQSVQITNCGSTDLEITGAHIEGAALTEFAIVSQDVAGVLAPAASKEVLVVMTPRTAGAKIAVLAVDHTGAQTFVDLVGNGLGADGNDEDDRVTYYHCGVGRPVSLAPLALVLGALVLRRRRRG